MSGRYWTALVGAGELGEDVVVDERQLIRVGEPILWVAERRGDEEAAAVGGELLPGVLELGQHPGAMFGGPHGEDLPVDLRIGQVPLPEEPQRGVGWADTTGPEVVSPVPTSLRSGLEAAVEWPRIVAQLRATQKLVC